MGNRRKARQACWSALDFRALTRPGADPGQISHVSLTDLFRGDPFSRIVREQFLQKVNRFGARGREEHA